MSTINRQKLQDLNKSFRVIFNDALTDDSPSPFQAGTVLNVDSQTSIEEYNWLNAFPRLREWIGERKVADFKAEDHQIKNRSYEATLGVKREHIMDENFGLYEPQIQSLANEYGRKVRRHLSALLQAGMSGTIQVDDDPERSITGYDGVSFFNDSHPRSKEGLGAESNVTDGGSDPLAEATIDEAMEVMETRESENGDILGVSPNLLVAGPAMRGAIGDRFELERKEGGASNRFFNMFDQVVIEPYLGRDDENIYMFDTSFALKPFIFQDRLSPELASKTDPTDDNVFMKNKYLYGVYARYGMGFGLWQLAHVIENTA
jgi:phage major head subunit gpT-like protein